MAEDTTRAINILVGVGGTGAKAVEATLIQLLSGMIENKVYVGLVDQDLANGNVARTVGLLTQQHRFRELWSGAKNKIEWGKCDSLGIGRTEILPLYSTKGEVDAVYRPNNSGSTLHQMLGRGLSKWQGHLFDMLFMDSEDEQHLQLDEGYRGRAHVGSAAFVAALSSGNNKLFEAIKRIAESSEGVPINVFFVGSAFGGTGAAGFPTLARRLHRMRDKDYKDKEGKPAFANAQSIRIGGLLMLPYFNFSAPEKGVAAVVTTDELLPKTQLALEYYHNLFKHEPSFDMFYALGWPEQYPLGYHEPGAKEQANPALPTEIIAATAAIHFFRHADKPAEEQKTKSFLSEHDDQWIDWRDLPCDAKEDNEHMLKMGQLLRFCAYWRYQFAPELSEPIDKSMMGRFLKRKNWAQRLAGDEHPADADEAIETLDELIGSILGWFAMVEKMADRIPGGQRLWSLGRVIDAAFTDSADSTPTEPIRVMRSGPLDRWEQTFDGLIVKESSGHEERSATAIYEELVTGAPEQMHAGIGKAVVRVYNACRVR